jgi:hypothetical protein
MLFSCLFTCGLPAIPSSFRTLLLPAAYNFRSRRGMKFLPIVAAVVLGATYDANQERDLGEWRSGGDISVGESAMITLGIIGFFAVFIWLDQRNR